MAFPRSSRGGANLGTEVVDAKGGRIEATEPNPRAQREVGRPSMGRIVRAAGHILGVDEQPISYGRGGAARKLTAWLGWREGLNRLRGSRTLEDASIATINAARPGTFRTNFDHDRRRPQRRDARPLGDGGARTVSGPRDFGDRVRHREASHPARTGVRLGDDGVGNEASEARGRAGEQAGGRRRSTRQTGAGSRVIGAAL